jgi:hypothetical protein
VTDLKPRSVNETDRWKSIRNTRWVSDDGRDLYSGATLAQRLMSLGLAEDVAGAVDILYGTKRGGYITTGVSAYRRTW